MDTVRCSCGLTKKKKLRRMKCQLAKCRQLPPRTHCPLVVWCCCNRALQPVSSSTPVGPHGHSSVQRRWHQRHCLVSLLPDPRYTTVFGADAREQIAEVALSSPISLIGMKQWSLPKLRADLIEQKVVATLSVEWLRQLLHRFKIRLRRTKTWKESTDPDFWQKYRAIRRLYRHRPSHGTAVERR